VKTQIIMDGVVVLNTELPQMVKPKPTRTFWVEFDYQTDKPVAVASTYDELEASWLAERKGLRGRYTRECAIVEQ
jgi:hypothetical protein